jgi:hypothetical protein
MIRWLAIATLSLSAAACDDSDVGDECSGMDVPVESGATSEGDIQRAQGSEIVEYDATFPCSSAVCVASLGRGAFCSSECRTDDHCPQPFACRTILTELDPTSLPEEVGAMLEQTYCVWRECVSDDDCGDRATYVCAKVEELSLGGELVRMCDWR